MESFEEPMSQMINTMEYDISRNFADHSISYAIDDE